ncbi:MAG: hypothetical protein ACREMY_18810, partial [bacterium]
MVDERDYKGLWWLPGDESDNRAGTLKVNKGELELELIGHFGRKVISQSETATTYSAELAKQPRIVGVSTDGKPITLEGHRSAGYTESFPGMATATYMRRVALIGKQFDEGERIRFDEISIGASDLNAWTGVSGFTKIERRLEENEDVGGYVWAGVGIE